MSDKRFCDICNEEILALRGQRIQFIPLGIFEQRFNAEGEIKNVDVCEKHAIEIWEYLKTIKKET